MSNLDPIPVTPGRGEMVDIYTQALMRLRGVIAGEDFTLASKRLAAQKIGDIHRHIAELRITQAAWSKRYIPDAYKNGALQDEALIERHVRSGYKKRLGGLHEAAAQVAAQGAMADFDVVADALDRTYVGYVRRAQFIGNKRKIAMDISGGIVESATRQTVQNRLLDELRKNAVAGKITVGKVTMNAKAYAELLARTLSRSVHTEGTLNRLNEYEIDLVLITNTGGVDFCRIFEDQIFSISGKSRMYPKLVHRPPYHPNCTHTLSGFVTEFANYNDLSIGKEFKASDSNLSARDLNKKYPIIKDDTRSRTKKTQKKAA